MNSVKTFIVLFAATLISACTNQPSKPTSSDYLAAFKAETGQDGRACVNNSDINGYGTLDPDSVVSIDSRRMNEYFVAVTNRRCDGIGTSSVAAIGGNDWELCGGRMDTITVAGDRCTIGGLFAYDSREAAFDSWDRVKAQFAVEKPTEKD
ncbi:hypothetical protein F3N42_13410 [Marinihelvus fidelis]|uniref:Lipoprotein n=1 Tax=Marinihelvus fidelis TaxID=2613842 RepID=A0A5N0TAG0_9GAMM|nr:DUF6491 family protein [Marinihelvus fidelis]KAA9130329.1 hypothetical protein F3N42_13410 [Marinihelvus fidelis]